MIDLISKADFLHSLETALFDYDYNVDMHGLSSSDCEEDRRWIRDLCLAAQKMKFIPTHLEHPAKIQNDDGDSIMVSLEEDEEIYFEEALKWIKDHMETI